MVGEVNEQLMPAGMESVPHSEPLSYQPPMTQTLHNLLGSLGVWSIFWFSAIGPYAFPAAGEIAILLAAATRAYPVPAIVILATAGGVASDHAAYWFGRRDGSRL